MSELDLEIEKIENEGKVRTGISQIDDLSGDDAKICGINYYKMVYVTSGLLVALMAFVFLKFEAEDPVRRMAFV